MLSRRTDLALEAQKLWSEENAAQKLSGASQETRDKNGFPVTTVHITDEHAAKELCKPIGTYVTVELGRFMRREDDAFSDGAKAIGDVINELIPEDGLALVVGLGNPAITPDAVGHLAVKCTLITRHLRAQHPEQFSAFRSVAAIEPGVLGITGVESVDIVSAVSKDVSPSVVIAVDALASRSMDRVCRTVQVSDTGIIPGSGVGNARKALNRDTLGVPVIAVGVPTVVDAATLAQDLALETGVTLNADALRRHEGAMIVTPREIDANVADISRLIGYGINIALHNGLSVENIDMLVG